MELLRRFLVGLLGMVDGAVYTLISIVYELLLKIANVSIFDESFLEAFASRVYGLLGLIMIFRVSFSLIQYIVNPDTFTDKLKGGKRLVLNVLMVLVLIVITPMAFTKLNELQKTILNEGVVEKLIFGSTGNAANKEKMGDEIKMLVFTAFYRPDDEACYQMLTSVGVGGSNTDTSNVNFGGEACGGLSSEAVAIYQKNYYAADVSNLVNEEVPGENEPLFMVKKRASEGENGETGGSEEKAENEYAINYMFVISTVAGVFVALIFLNFCIDIAIRAVKFGFLQVIAPIPIISYLDPNSSKNGMFSRWLKEVFKTYADLFVRLASVYFAITLIANLQVSGEGIMTKVFVIFGILIFAGQVPRLISELFGIKVEGNFSLNPLSKIRTSPIANAVAAGAVGGAAGLASNLAASPLGEKIGSTINTGREKVTNVVNKGAEKVKSMASSAGGTVASHAPAPVQAFGRGVQTAAKTVAKPVGAAAKSTMSTFAGGVSGMARGAMAGSRGKSSPVDAGFQGATESSRARNARVGGFNAMDKVYDKFTDIAGIRQETGTTSEIENQMKINSMAISDYKRDEATYARQVSRISEANSTEFNKAFAYELEKDDNKNAQLDEDGNIKRTYKYKDYDSYFKDNTADVTQQALENRAGQIMHEKNYASDETGHARAMLEARNEIARERGMITEHEYNDYRIARDSMNQANRDARNLEKRNKELQGYLNAKSGKPPKNS